MKRKLHTQLDWIFPSVADPVQSKQSKQKAVHDYHAKERTLEEDQAVQAKDFRYKKTWLPGTLVEKTGPVSAQVQLDDGTVIRRHQDHFRVRESEGEECNDVILTFCICATVWRDTKFSHAGHIMCNRIFVVY